MILVSADMALHSIFVLPQPSTSMQESGALQQVSIYSLYTVANLMTEHVTHVVWIQLYCCCVILLQHIQLSAIIQAHI